METSKMTAQLIWFEYVNAEDDLADLFQRPLANALGWQH